MGTTNLGRWEKEECAFVICEEHNNSIQHSLTTSLGSLLTGRNMKRTKIMQTRPGNELVLLCWGRLYTFDAADSRSDTGLLEDCTASYLLLPLVLDS